MEKRSVLLAIAVIMALAALVGCARDNAPPVDPAQPPASAQAETPSSLQDTEQGREDAAGEVVITFDYARQTGHASNQFAVWVEDADGNFVKTLYATGYTANGGYKNRPDSIPAWVERSGLSSMEKSEVDAVAGATPQAGALSYTWDLTDTDGNAVPPGAYSFFVEGSLRWKNRVLYSGAIEVGGTPVTAQADRLLLFDAGENQPALTEDSPETGMIGAVTASFTPH